jgi:hypothetical protein
MAQVVVGYVAVAILLASSIFQHQLTIASPEDSEEAPDDNVAHCAALGCPGNPPNPHGPPTEEPASR